MKRFLQPQSWVLQTERWHLGRNLWVAPRFWPCVRRGTVERVRAYWPPVPSRGLASRVKGVCSRNVVAPPHVLSTDPFPQASQTPQLPTHSLAWKRTLSLSILVGEFPFPRSGPQPTSQRSLPRPSRVTQSHRTALAPKAPSRNKAGCPRGTCMSTCFPPGAHPFPGSPSISSQASCSPWNSYLQIHPGTAPTHCSPRRPPTPDGYQLAHHILP